MTEFFPPRSADLSARQRRSKLLGSGPRAEVYLSESTKRPIAVKVFRPTTSQASIDTEVAALTRVSNRHVLSLSGVVADASGRPCLLFPALGDVTLDSLLARPSALTTGQLVTALGPVAAAVAALHRDGVSHGAIRARAVHVDGQGSPVLIGFGRARLRDVRLAPSISEISYAAAVLDDLRRLGRLTELALNTAVALSNLPVSAAHLREHKLLAWLRSFDLNPSDASPGTERDFEHRARAIPFDFATELGLRLLELTAPEPLLYKQPDRAFSAAPGWPASVGPAASFAVSPPASPAANTTANRVVSLATSLTPKSAAASSATTGAPAPATFVVAATFAAPAAVAAPATVAVAATVAAAATATKVAAAPPGSAAAQLEPGSLSSLPEATKSRNPFRNVNIDESPMAALKIRVIAALAPVRKSVWVAGGLGAAALIIALGVVPLWGVAVTTGAPVPQVSVSPGKTTTLPPTQWPSAEASGQPIPSQPSTPQPSASEPSASEPAGNPPGAAAAIKGDDALAAAIALLALRQSCLDDHTPKCLVAVDQAGSAAEAMDTALLAKFSGPIPDRSALRGGTVTLVQALGGSAILSVALPDSGGNTQPASLLIIRGEAGWRIRDVELGS